MTAPLSTLNVIRDKVRLLTGSPSTTQLTDSQINEYVNTFYLYDMPEQLRLFNLTEEYEFYTQPNIDTYAFPRNPSPIATPPAITQPGFVTVNPPAYIAGYQSFWSQSEDNFYRIYPQLEFIEELTTGTNIAGPYSFTFTNRPFLRGYIAPGNPRVFSQVLVTGVTATGTNEVARDDGNGGWINADVEALMGTINYVTGVGTVTFEANITGVINGQNIPYVAARPQAILFFNDLFFLRPVPDQSYKVQMEAFRTPAALLASGDNPLLNEWWQYLAFGASKKVLEDRLDTDGLSKVMPFLEEQQRLILRRTIVQQTNERTATIYTEQTQYPTNNNFNSF